MAKTDSKTTAPVPDHRLPRPTPTTPRPSRPSGRPAGPSAAPTSPTSTGAERPFYNLMMFPYPSAEGLHVGNMFAFTGSDIYGRFKRLQGLRRLRADRVRRVRHPQRELRDQGRHQPGDADPAEHRELPPPAPPHRRHVRLAPRAVAPPIPAYYKWTQWIFLQLFKAGKAYKKAAAVNWCPQRQDRAGQRAGHQRPLRALRHAWSSSGRWSSGSSGSPSTPTGCWPIWTTSRRWTGRRPRRHGAAQLARPLARARRSSSRRGDAGDVRGDDDPRLHHPRRHASSAPRSWCWRPSIRWWTAGSRPGPARRRSTRTARPPRRRTWCPARWASARRPASSPAATRRNPATGKQIPVWIADYVLMEYGTGAIMAVPGHDERDFEFATQVRPAHRPRRRAIRAPAPTRPLDDGRTPDNESGVLVNSGQFDGLTVPEAKRAITELAREQGAGKAVVSTACTTGASRASATGARRFPIIYCDEHGAVPVPGEGPAGDAPAHRGLPPGRHRHLTARAPRGVVPRALSRRAASRAGARPTSATPSSTRRGTTCAIPSTEFDDRPFDQARTQHVAAGAHLHRRQRARGAAPACTRGSSRMVLHDAGARSHFEEPYKKFRAHGLIVKDGAKMSKSRGNVVMPDEYIAQLGRRHLPDVPDVPGPVPGGRRLPRRGHQRAAAVPGQGLGAGGRRLPHARGRRGPARDAGQVPPDGEAGDRGHGGAALQHRRSRR